MTTAIWRVAFPVEDELREALAECLMEAGAGAILEETAQLVVFGDTAQAEKLEAVYAAFQATVALAFPGSARIASLRSPVDPDYHRSWLDRLEPVRLTECVLLCPLGKEPDPDFLGRVLYFEPQPSFGSGEHETTRLMAAAIERSLAERARGGDVQILDVGTGTGVLAFVALVSGATEAVATDIDPVSIEAARENAHHNGLSERLTLIHGSFPEDSRQFALVVANIDRNTLARIASELGSRVAPGGELMLTGLLHEDVRSVEPLYLAHGFRRREVLAGREFALLIFDRTEKGPDKFQ